MKKTVAIVLLAVMLVCVSFMFTGCSKEKPITYEVMKSTFAFGTDGQHFSPAIELSVGETVYMALQVKINGYDEDGNPAGKDEVKCSLTIPKITAIDAYYYSGQSITGVTDQLTGAVTYTFTIGTNTTKADGDQFIFKFVPAEAGSVRMDLTFSEEIPERFNTFKIVDFVGGDAE